MVDGFCPELAKDNEYLEKLWINLDSDDKIIMWS